MNVSYSTRQPSSVIPVRRRPGVRALGRGVGGDARRVLKSDPPEEDPAEVDRHHEKEGQQRQDERELDHALAPSGWAIERAAEEDH